MHILSPKGIFPPCLQRKYSSLDGLVQHQAQVLGRLLRQPPNEGLNLILLTLKLLQLLHTHTEEEPGE